MLNLWATQAKEAISKVKVKAENQLGSISLELEKEYTPTSALNALLCLIAAKLPDRTALRGSNAQCSSLMKLTDYGLIWSKLCCIEIMHTNYVLWYSNLSFTTF